MALRDLGTEFEHYRTVEFDRFAIKSYNAIHSTDFETTDICNINGVDLGICDTDKYCYIMTYSFPCQDLSVAGKQKGMVKGSGTRSGLLWEVERLLNECSELPQVLLMENVPQVHSKTNMPDFQKWIDFLESKGYSNYWQDLNAKDYGIAQNRDRCFMVSLLGEWNYKFPQPIPLERKLKNYLEDEVDEKYYINTEKAQKLIQQLIDNGTLQSQTSTCYSNGEEISKFSDIAKTISARDYKGFSGSFQKNERGCRKSPNRPIPKQSKQKTVSNCITAREDRGNIKSAISRKWSGGMEVKQIGNLTEGASRDNPNRRRVYDANGLSPTLTSAIGEGGNLQPFVVAERRLGNIYGFDGGNYAGNVYDDEMLSPTIRTYQGGNQQPMIIDSPKCLNSKRGRKGVEGLQPSVQDRVYDTEGISTSIITSYMPNILEKQIVAMRGKNPDNPSDRTAGSTQKDNMVLEGMIIDDTQRFEDTPRVYTDNSPTLRSERSGLMTIENQYRIRKLTPLECWRLMGFSDEDFEKAESVNSNSQLYRQAGNSIVKNVLMAIFGQMMPRKENIYKEL